MTYKIDWTFLREVEGSVAKGYVPEDNDGPIKSGVTIGTGFDLGQQSMESLERYHFSLPLLLQLQYFAGLTGCKAKKALNDKGLTLAEDQLEELEEKVNYVYAKQIEEEYNNNSGLRFRSLDEHQQTVIVSVGFQYGSLKRRCPRFFKYITLGEWLSAVKELEDFGDAYPTRRNKEARLLSLSLRHPNNTLC